MVVKLTVNSAEEDALWQEYNRTPSVQIRNLLVQRYVPLVKYLANKYVKKDKKDNSVDTSDLAQEGIFGLIDAINSYDISNGIKFSIYAHWRVVGAMKDHFRKLDFFGTTLRNRISKRERLADAVYQQTGDSQIAREEAEKIVSKFFPQTLSLDDILFESSNKTKTLKDSIKVPDEIAKADLRDYIKSYIMKGFKREEKIILELYYLEGLTMKEIGEVLDLGESRISQIHADILKRLREIKTPEIAFC